jgi:hypothetical protein
VVKGHRRNNVDKALNPLILTHNYRNLSFSNNFMSHTGKATVRIPRKKLEIVKR